MAGGGRLNDRPYLLGALRRDYLLWILLAALVVLSVLAPREIPHYPALVNWPTVGTLLGLMILTKGLELSGWLHHVGRQLLARVHTERGLALFLVVGSALLAMFLTNDVALFISVPLTLELGALARLPLRRLVMFEAFAVNTGALLTPIGNPQNIFLWQLSQVKFGAFVLHMLPAFVIAGACLLVLVVWGFAAKRVHFDPQAVAVPVRRSLLFASALLYIPFLVLSDLHYAAAGLALVGMVFILGFRSTLRRIEWPLLLILVLMFIDLGRLAQYPVLAYVNLAERGSLYVAGVISSQVISNVPTSILLSHYSRDWGTIAWAVDVGGFGMFSASLANLIALRLGRQRGALLAFHAWSLPFCVCVAGLLWVWLRFA
ncbi:MAG: SLC13 family permease [Gammaproteobacteria bacterium]